MTASRISVVRSAARLWRLAVVDGSPDPARVRAIVDQLITSSRAVRFAVLDRFTRLLRKDRTGRSAEIASAKPLDSETRAALANGLTRRYGHAMNTAFVVDPALIGGVRIRAASEVFDDTVRARLSAVEVKG